MKPILDYEKAARVPTREVAPGIHVVVDRPAKVRFFEPIVNATIEIPPAKAEIPAAPTGAHNGK